PRADSQLGGQERGIVRGEEEGGRAAEEQTRTDCPAVARAQAPDVTEVEDGADGDGGGHADPSSITTMRPTVTPSSRSCSARGASRRGTRSPISGRIEPCSASVVISFIACAT